MGNPVLYIGLRSIFHLRGWGWELISLGRLLTWLLTLHSISFIRDGANFCLGLSLIFSSIFPSPVPYSSLIFWVNLDRCRMWKYYGSAPSLSNISYNCLNMGERPSGMQIGAVEHILLYARSSNPNSAFRTHCALSLNFLEKARPCLLFFSAICLPSLIVCLL